MSQTDGPNPGTEPRKRILVVDDDPQVTQMVVTVLQSNGFDAWVVNDPRQVLDRAKDLRPDLIILDFDMPQLLGTEVSTSLKSTSQFRNTPIIFLSGMTDEDHHVIGNVSGGAAYLDKPPDTDKLILTIRELLGRR